MGKLMQRYSEQIDSSFSLPTSLLHAQKFGSDFGVNQSTTADHDIPAAASQQPLRYLAQGTVASASLAVFPETSLASKKTSLRI